MEGPKRRLWIIAATLLMFSATLALRFGHKNASDAVLALNAIPIALVAFEFGWKVGLAASAVAFAAVVVWGVIQEVGLTAVGYLIRGTTYCGIALVIGLLADHLRASRAAERRLERRQATHDLELEGEARRAVSAERARLARELHDVVSHSLSLITLQASGIRRVMERKPEKVPEAIEAIETSGREALVELRRLLEILRAEGTIADPVTPPPKLENIDTLISQMEGAGVRVGLRIEGEARALPPGIELSVYRIVQEALTNVLKHAGAASADIVLRYRPQEIQVRVRDDGRGATRDAARGGRGGYGLAGMRERAAFFGGELRAGPRVSGGYVVEASLPLDFT